MAQTYIWQHKDWPHFTWDDTDVARKSYAYIQKASQLVGEVKHLSEAQKSDALIDLMVSEAVKTSQIEGENFDREDVRSSIRNQLGLNATLEPVRDPKSNGVAALMISARAHFRENLSEKRLCDWQDLIIVGDYQRAKLTVGAYRSDDSPMQIVSGAVGKEKIHYQAPASPQVPREMNQFLSWFNSSSDLTGITRAGIAHLYFESIHPFSDGNGRIGRAISEIALSQELGHPALLSLSTTIQKRRTDYYDALNRASVGGLDITNWLNWFADLVLEAQEQARLQIDYVLSKARFWAQYATQLNARQTKVINRMLREGPAGFKGGMSALKYTKITNCSKATATRDLAALHAMGIFQRQNGGGRSTGYDLRLET